jgi:phenylacetic acid degradation protein
MTSNCYAYDGMIPVVHPTAFVHPTAVLIGDVHIGPGVYVAPGACLRGDFSSIHVGEGANLQEYCMVHGTPGFPITIEANGHIGHGATVHGCTVGRNALVGINSAIYDGAVIGENSVVAAMAFVTAGTKVPPGVLVAGIPAKVIKELSEAEIARKTRGTEAYQELARRCIKTLEKVAPLSEPEPGRENLNPSARWPSDLTRHTPTRK